MATFDKRGIGKQAEEEACHYLQAQGLALLTRNYYSPFGEIDLIMQDQAAIVFVEVRSRHRLDYGRASESITRAKIKRLQQSAIFYLQKKRCLHKVDARFDVIDVTLSPQNNQLEWIKHAFEVSN